MNIAAINQGYIANFERNAPFDFYVFYPKYVNNYDYHRGIDGHIADVNDSDVLTHSAIRRFVRKVTGDEDMYRDLHSAFNKEVPDGKVYEFEGKQLVVRHMRGHWTTASSMKDVNVYFNNPLFGTTSMNLAHNFYMCWVGGYQRNRVYYGDLVVPVARQRVGPTIRNESALPIQIVRGILNADRINGTGLVLEDWVEYREEYKSYDWDREDVGSVEDGYYRIPGVTEYDEYRLIYTNDEGTQEVLYFEPTADKSGIVTRSPLPSSYTDPRVEKFNTEECGEVNSNAY